jgi:hypothetical protein
MYGRAFRSWSRVGAILAVSLSGVLVLSSCPSSSTGSTSDSSSSSNEPPKIELSATSLSFSGNAGGTDPSAQPVAVTNGGGSALTGLSASVSYADGDGWLNVTISANAAPATLTVHPSVGALAIGTYTAAITVSSSVAGAETVNVTLTVSQGGAIGLSPTSLTFSGSAGGNNPAAKQVNISNAGAVLASGLTESISYESGSGWLNASLNVTTAPAVLTVQPSTGSLAAGSYTATITISSSVAGISARTVGVTFVVGQGPSIGLSLASLTFSGTVGAVSDPSSQGVTISNSGGGSLTGLSASISYGSGSGWLGVSLNTATAPATLTVQPSTGTLALGTYTATITVSSSISGVSPQTVNVTFNVPYSALLSNAVISDYIGEKFAWSPAFSPTVYSYTCTQVASVPSRTPFRMVYAMLRTDSPGKTYGTGTVCSLASYNESRWPGDSSRTSRGSARLYGKPAAFYNPYYLTVTLFDPTASVSVVAGGFSASGTFSSPTWTFELPSYYYTNVVITVTATDGTSVQYLIYCS